MKKIILLTILFLSGSFLFAQVIEKDKRILGGAFNTSFGHSQWDTLASSEPTVKNSNFSFSLSPSLGKAIKNNLVFGYQLSIFYSHGKNENLQSKETGKSGGKGFGGGVFLEKFFPLSKSLSFSGSMPLQLYYTSLKDESFQNGSLERTSSSKYYGVNLGLYPSLNYSLNKKFILQLTLNNFVSLGYFHSTNETEGPNITPSKLNNSSFGFSTQVNGANQLSQLSFAFRYIF